MTRYHKKVYTAIRDVYGKEVALELFQLATACACNDDAVAVGAWWHAIDYHSGQSCPLYALQCAIPYRPSPHEKGPQGYIERHVWRTLQEAAERKWKDA
jgi:hypothetical protein